LCPMKDAGLQKSWSMGILPKKLLIAYCSCRQITVEIPIRTEEPIDFCAYEDYICL
jgi:hypothetical protein